MNEWYCTNRSNKEDWPHVTVENMAHNFHKVSWGLRMKCIVVIKVYFITGRSVSLQSSAIRGLYAITVNTSQYVWVQEGSVCESRGWTLGFSCILAEKKTQQTWLYRLVKIEHLSVQIFSPVSSWLGLVPSACLNLCASSGYVQGFVKAVGL